MPRSWFTCRSTGHRKADVSIYDDIGGWGLSAKDFLSDIKKLGDVDEINIRINSGGGDVFDGLAIYNGLRSHGARITAHVDGIAASIASVIAMAGNEISMPESAWMMIHDPSGLVVGTADMMQKTAETLRGIKKSLVGIYVRRTGLPEDEVENLMSEETWMDGRDAVARGFATYLVESQPIAAYIDLSKFNRVPEPVFRACASAKERPMTDVNSDNPTLVAEDRTSDTTDKPARRDRRTLIDELSAAQEQKIEERKPKSVKPSPSPREEHERVEREAKKLAAEQAKAINDVYRSAGLLGLTDECSRLFDEGFEPDQITPMLVEIKAKLERKRAAVGNLIPSGIEVGHSYEDPKVVANDMAEAITASVVPGYKISDRAREYMNWRPMGFMRAMLEIAGKDTRRMQPADIVNAAMTTSDFPNLLGTSANKIFLGAYDAAEGTYRRIAARRDVPNFQIQDLLRPGDYPVLQVVNEGGEITAGGMSERKEQAQLKTYGRMIQLSRQMLVNDSLGAFGDLAAKAGVAAAQLENVTVWGLLAGTGPTLSDTFALFDATNHGNYATTGTALSDSADLAAGRTKMRLQKSLDGNALNIVPAILAVPATLETTAEAILNPLAIPTTLAGIATPSLRTLSLLVEPLLDGHPSTGTTAWYLFASPVLRSGAIVYGGLEGNTGPRVTVDNPFNVDGIQIRVIHDFYAAVADYRYVYKATGAA